jgi:hypothetical protein
VRDRSAPTSVTVLVNGVPSSHLDLDDPTWLEFEYMQVMAEAVGLLPPGPLDAVHLGAAACTFPRWLEAVRPGSRQLAVDVDGDLLTRVRTWFDLPRSPRLRLRAGEARTVVEGLGAGTADLVVRDVFAGDSTPAHLTTEDFVAAVARVLRPDGVYLANCADRPPLDLVRSEVATARTHFDQVALLAEPAVLKGRRYGNLVLAATGTAGPDLTDPGLDRRLRSLPVPTHVLVGDRLSRFVGTAPVRRDPPSDAVDPSDGARPAATHEGPHPSSGAAPRTGA